MSPEQAHGHRAIGPASDVWALGIILYELLLGFRPQAAPDPGDPLADLSLVDPSLARIVVRCLATDPADRYSSASDLATELRSWVRPTPVRPRRRLGQRVALGVAVLAVAAISAIVLLHGGTSPDTAPQTIEELRQQVRDRLVAGETVVLIDGDGNAAPVFRLIGIGTNSGAARNPNGWWTLHSNDLCFAEFLDDPGVPAFVLSGEVRGEWANGLPVAGLFLGQRRLEDLSGKWDFQIQYGFREAGPNHRMGASGKAGPPLQGEERFVRLLAKQDADIGNVPQTVFQAPILADRPAVGGPWRTLEARMDGNAFSASWDGKLDYTTAKFSARDVDQVQLFLKARPDPPIAFQARAGLGVYVDSGSAAFRNLRITPAAVSNPP